MFWNPDLSRPGRHKTVAFGAVLLLAALMSVSADVPPPLGPNASYARAASDRREFSRERAGTGSDLHHGVCRNNGRESDDTLQDVAVGEEVLAVALLQKRPVRDSNPCYSLERAVSWTGLDERDRSNNSPLL